MAAASGRASAFLSEEPIFVVGMPRTGTSLVDRILSMHPCVTSAGELSNFTQILKAMVETGDSLPLDGASLTAIAAGDLGALGRAYVESTRPVTGRTPCGIRGSNTTSLAPVTWRTSWAPAYR